MAFGAAMALQKLSHLAAYRAARKEANAALAAAKAEVDASNRRVGVRGAARRGCASSPPPPCVCLGMSCTCVRAHPSRAPV